MENSYIELYLKGMIDMNNMPEIRRNKLKKLLVNKDYIRVMEASN